MDSHYFRGRLSEWAASLVYVLPNEILKWQYSANAAEKLIQLGIWIAPILRFSSVGDTHR